MEPSGNKSIRLKHLSIRGFKGLDSLEIEFPLPLTELDADVLVLGSRNGLGKTSVLEACAMLYLGLSSSVGEIESRTSDTAKIAWWNRRFGDLLIRSGHDAASIRGEFQVAGNSYAVEVKKTRGKKAAISGQLIDLLGETAPKYVRTGDFQHSLFQILGFVPEPLILPLCLHFHSYRKVQEDNPRLSAPPAAFLGSPARPRGRNESRETVSSQFKLEILNLLMEQAKLFDNIDEAESESALSKLNLLMATYAGGRIKGLRPFRDNTVDILIQPLDGRPPFVFDGLSSGQKEILSTLYMIWRHTHSRPATVLINEPELHLNAEWHRTIIRDLHALVPENQYIIATHSEDVFASVEERQRLLLVPDNSVISR